MTGVDVAVVGAGAAGLAAAARLRGSGLSTIILEARGRVGGRAHTSVVEGFPLDLGCGWLHSADRNPWTTIAADLGFAIDRTRPAWREDRIGLSAPDAEAFAAAAEAFFERVAAFDPHGADAPASSLLQPDCRFNPLIEAVCAYVNGASPRDISAVDWRRYEDSGVNWRVVEGYGATIAAHDEGLRVELVCPVTRIDHSGRTIVLETSKGALRAGAVIVTTPTSVIAAEAIAFRPALPRKIEAAGGLPLGVADKLVMAAGPGGPPKGHAFGDATRARTGSYEFRPFGRPLVEGFFGGDLARELETAGPGAFFEFARDELARLLGAKFAAGLRPVSETAWAADPFAKGSYSFALPGRSDERAALAAPVDGRLFFAGEACSEGSFSTAHGAYLTGIAAAEAILVGRAGDAP